MWEHDHLEEPSGGNESREILSQGGYQSREILPRGSKLSVEDLLLGVLHDIEAFA